MVRFLIHRPKWIVAVVGIFVFWLAQTALVDGWPREGARAPGDSEAPLPGQPGQRRALDAVVYLAGWSALVGAAALAHRVLAGGMGGVSLRALAGNLPQLLSSLGKVVFPLDPTVLAAPEDISPWPGVIAAAGLAAGARFVPGVRRRATANPDIDRARAG